MDDAPPPVDLQLVEAEDARALAAVGTLFQEYADGLGVDLSFQGFDRELRGLPGAYAPPGGALWLARRGGHAIGCVALKALEPPLVAEIKRLYVRPEGRGLGLGRRLAEAAIDHARGLGYARLRLDTLPGMGQAQALYLALGFRAIAPYRFNPVPGAQFLELALA